MPAPKPRFVGIDLGTTYSCVGVYHAGTGHVEIIPDAEGRRTMPSVVAYTGDGAALVGASAKQQQATNPTRTIFEAKHFIGQPYTPALAALAARFPFQVVNASGSPRFSLPGGAGTGEMVLSPEDVGAKVVTALKLQAEAKLGVPIKRVVMSVPADFNAAQRNATERVGNMAGLEVLRVISEPTAAAMAYGIHKRTDEVDLLMVFDFGGGTLDVSLLSIEGSMFITSAIAGNTHLGGEDLRCAGATRLRLRFAP